jgi:hypothetical protein
VENNVSATSAQLDQAARLSVARQMPFADALNAVLQDPSAASMLERGSNSPETSAILEAFSRGTLAGRTAVQVEQRETETMKRLQDLETLTLENVQAIEQTKRATVGLGAGFANHLQQHAQVQAGTRQQFDPQESANIVLQAMSEAGLSAESAQEFVDTIGNLPKPKALKAPTPTKKPSAKEDFDAPEDEE